MSVSTFSESFRKLVSVAHRFVSGEAPFIEFYYSCAQARREVRGDSIDQKVLNLLSEWSDLAERCRNEFGESSLPLSEQQVRERITRDLAEIVA